MKLNLLILFLFFSGQLRSQEFEEVSLSAFGVYQHIYVDVDIETRFKVKALIKVDTMDKSAWAGIYAAAYEEGESYGFYDNMGDRPITSNLWEEYEVVGTINKKSESIQLGVQGFNTGIYYFDNIQLFIEDYNGKFIETTIPNPGFEEKMVDNIIPNWDQYHIDESYQKPKSIIVRTKLNEDKSNRILEFDASKVRPPITVGKYEGESLQIGTLITMLEDLRTRVFEAVETLDLNQTDYLFDDKANRIGALIMHLVAAEKYYQVLTFEGLSFNEEETFKWQMALDLGQPAREAIKGKNIDFYLMLYEETRQETIKLLKSKDDEWLRKSIYPGINNHYCWFHVMEHQSSHLGQILFYKRDSQKKKNLKSQCITSDNDDHASFVSTPHVTDPLLSIPK